MPPSCGNKTAMRRRPALPAFCAALVLVIGQLIAFAHQAATRHVTCSEHGEQLELASLEETLHACGDDHLVGVEHDANGAHHDDCLLARAMHQSGAAPDLVLAPQVALLGFAAVAPAPREVASASTLLRIAPKTSPPA